MVNADRSREHAVTGEALASFAGAAGSAWSSVSYDFVLAQVDSRVAAQHPPKD
jgi:hypothetical protein